LVLAIRRLTAYMVEEFGLSNIEDTNDGIIFEPVESSLHLDTLKWKFPSKITIDFLAKYYEKKDDFAKCIIIKNALKQIKHV
jgi:hypothetical protein